MIRTSFVAIALLAAPAIALAQALPLQMERWAAQCNNNNREYDANAARAACTAIIRSDNASSGARAFAYRQRGAVRLEQGDVEGALGDFGSAIRHNPHFTAAYISRASVYEAQRDYDRALLDYDQVLRIAPDFGPAYNARCWLKTLSGRDLISARSDCDRAIDMGVGANAYDTRGLLNLRSGQFEAAWADYDRAVTLSPASAHQLYGRGLAALGLGREEAGRADIAAAIALDAAVAGAYQTYGFVP
ncbi:MAG: hypothetical protein A4S17_04795 [Proteobacteria bacterium HN_bin10]|nr:MAG: hypothetical protein A4S17_04795 [Proteobacteria bacterium HN_bin10]